MQHDDDEWISPFDDAFDDETSAFPYGTYGHTAPMVRTPLGTVRQFLHMLQSAESCDSCSQLFVDVGCGDGAVLNAVAKQQPHWQLLGVDIAEKTLEDAQRSADVEGTSHQISFRIGDYREILPLCDEMLSKSSTVTGSDLMTSNHDVIRTDSKSGSTVYSSILLYIYLIPSMIRNSDFRQQVIEPLLQGGAKIVVWCYLPGADDGLTGAEWPFLWQQDT
jgi:SAM-dependent methyltransferase